MPPRLTIDGRRNAALIRCLRLRRRLGVAAYAPPLSVLAAEFGVTTRTIRRDLQALEFAGESVPRWRFERVEA